MTAPDRLVHRRPGDGYRSRVRSGTLIGVQHLLRDQAGVVARRQLIDLGLQDHDIRRLVRRRELVVVHPGVFRNHTGEPTWLQRAWAGVLYAWPAVLSGTSAMRAVEGPGRKDRETGDVAIAVAWERRVRAQPGLSIERRRDLEKQALWNVGPPRLRHDEAILDLALAATSDMGAIAVLSEACGSRRTTASRLAVTMASRSRAPRRAWIDSVLRDVAEGTCSVLEHGYLTRVERPHGLPRARRQVRAVSAGGVVYRDAQVADLVVELDGRLFHDSTTARDRDMERDLDASVEGGTTLRLGWGQVFDRPCSTAWKIGRVLAAQGWTGIVQACGPTCA